MGELHHHANIPRLNSLRRLAQAFDIFHAHPAEWDEEDLIELQVDHVVEFRLQPHQRGGAQPTEKHRILSAEAEVFAGLGDFSQPLGVGDVVGDNPRLHRFSPAELIADS